MKKCLFICPEVSNSGGAGRWFWNLAALGKDSKDWEPHLLAPVTEKDRAKTSNFCGFREIKTSKKRLWEFPEVVLKEAFSYNREQDFDMVYLISELRVFPQKERLKEFRNLVIGVHNQTEFFRKYNPQIPILQQLDKISPNRRFEEMMEYSPSVSTWHLISSLEERIWNHMTSQKNYVVFPDMIPKQEDFGLPYSERKNDIFFCGRVTGYGKGLAMVRGLMEKFPDVNYRMTVPFCNMARASQFFKKFENCKYNYFQDHTDVLKEMGKHKVFCNPGTYGPFDLTMLEAASQGCQIVASDCIGATEYVRTHIPTEFTVNGFKEAINKALKETEAPKQKLQNLEDNIDNFFNSLYVGKIK